METMALESFYPIQYINVFRREIHGEGIAIEPVYPERPEMGIIQRICTFIFEIFNEIEEPHQPPIVDKGEIKNTAAWVKHKILTPPCILLNGCAIVVCCGAMTVAGLHASAKVALFILSLGNIRLEQPTGFYRSGSLLLGSALDIVRNVWEVGHDSFWLMVNTGNMLGLYGAVTRFLTSYPEVISRENLDVAEPVNWDHRDMKESGRHCLWGFRHLNSLRWACFQKTHMFSPERRRIPTTHPLTMCCTWIIHKPLAAASIVGDLAGAVVATVGMTVAALLVSFKVAAYTLNEKWKFTFSTGFTASGMMFANHIYDVCSILREVITDVGLPILLARETCLRGLIDFSARSTVRVGEFAFDSLK
jgi:hypothetical protein